MEEEWEPLSKKRKLTVIHPPYPKRKRKNGIYKPLKRKRKKKKTSTKN